MDTRAFLQGQIRVLDTPIRLSLAYESPDTLEQIPAAVMERIGEQVSAAIKVHNRTAYPTEATSALAEQVEILWHSMHARARMAKGKGTVPFTTLGEDASEQMLMVGSPSVKSRESGLETFAETQRYTQLRDRLVALKESRQEKQAAVDLLERLVSEISILELPSQNLQAQLATRDGKIAQELRHMNSLLRRANRKLLAEDEVEDS